jgi:hypothetical protein
LNRLRRGKGRGHFFINTAANRKDRQHGRNHLGELTGLAPTGRANRLFDFLTCLLSRD